MEANEHIYPDASRQAILQKFLKKTPQLLCPSGYLAGELCTNPKCKQSLKCANLMCPSCGLKVHKDCRTIPLEQMVKQINKKVEEQMEKQMEIIILEEEFTKKISRGLTEFAKQLVGTKINHGSRKEIERIFNDGDYYALCGLQARKLFEKLFDKQTQNKKKTEEKRRKYEKWLENQFVLINQKKRQNFLKVKPRFEDHPVKIANSFIHHFQVSLPQLKIDSKVLQQRGKITQDIQFIRKSLKNPRSLSQIFRAGEHNFKYKLFHKYCDDINDTFVLLRTQYGKTMAGYTNYKWNEVNNAPVHDKGRKTFILQLDLKITLKPVSDQYLIVCSKLDGPIFGSDLHIENNCNTVRQYNWVRPYCNYNVTQAKPFEFEDLCASTKMGGKGEAFKVVEYEVYQVLW